MFWKLRVEKLDEQPAEPFQGKRFVLHRHHDEAGEHLDLRLEADHFLAGWRIDGVELAGDLLATEKSPHPVQWLDEAAALRADHGVYQRHDEGARRIIKMKGAGGGFIRLVAERLPDPPVAAIYELRQALEEQGLKMEDAARLVQDGLTARKRAMARLCGLGRELDGPAFDEKMWRAILERLSLAEIHSQLRAFEVRFDQKYPPAPVSRAEKLPEEGTGRASVMAILHE